MAQIQRGLEDRLMFNRIQLAIISLCGLFITTIAYTAFNGYGFDTVEGTVITHLAPPLIGSVVSYFLFHEWNKKDKGFVIFAIIAVLITMVFVEFSYRNIDNLFY